MNFVVHTPDDVEAISGRFKVEENGTLIVDEPARDMRTTYAPTAWVKVEEELPKTPPPPMPQRIR